MMPSKRAIKPVRILALEISRKNYIFRLIVNFAFIYRYLSSKISRLNVKNIYINSHLPSHKHKHTHTHTHTQTNTHTYTYTHMHAHGAHFLKSIPECTYCPKVITCVMLPAVEKVVNPTLSLLPLSLRFSTSLSAIV